MESANVHGIRAGGRRRRRAGLRRPREDRVVLGTVQAAAPERQPTPRGRTTVPHPAHTAALLIPGERTGVAPELGERGFLKVGLPEAANND